MLARIRGSPGRPIEPVPHIADTGIVIAKSNNPVYLAPSKDTRVLEPLELADHLLTSAMVAGATENTCKGVSGLVRFLALAFEVFVALHTVVAPECIDVLDALNE